ncbi:MAG: putative RNA methyltransferase [Actinomycetota bacterium]
MLTKVVGYLACPVCGRDLSLTGSTVRCADGHTFDVARQGYANLLPGDTKPGMGDTAAMVAAREEFLRAGHYAPILREVVAQSEREDGAEPGCVIDLGAGTGFYLAAVLDRYPERVGVALDVSKYAARRAARAHERMGAVVCNVWRRLPVRSETAALVLNVFSPRNGEEIRRVLRADGSLVVVVPTERHLEGLVEVLGLVTVDARKEERLRDELDPYFDPATTATCEFSMQLFHHELETLVAMGPSARHTDAAATKERVGNLPAPTIVTASVTVTSYRPR